MFDRIPRAKTFQAGFTLIEVLVGMIIIAATASSVFYGVTYARAEIRKIIIRERALEELSGYMDYWVARINYGELSIPDQNGDLSGEEVVIYNPTDPEDETLAIVAKIYRDPIDEEYSSYNANNAYFILSARIEWIDHLSNNEPAEIYMETKTFKFK
ncbi:type II secretion system protein [bacterium]|nr:type II secretion system protein [bacterium]